MARNPSPLETAPPRQGPALPLPPEPCRLPRRPRTARLPTAGFAALVFFITFFPQTSSRSPYRLVMGEKMPRGWLKTLRCSFGRPFSQPDRKDGLAASWLTVDLPRNHCARCLDLIERQVIGVVRPVGCVRAAGLARHVRSDVAAPAINRVFLAFRAISWAARATEENGRSTTASTPSLSNHRRTVEEPMSALFWWSACTIVIGLPCTVPPRSSATI